MAGDYAESILPVNSTFPFDGRTRAIRVAQPSATAHAVVPCHGPRPDIGSARGGHPAPTSKAGAAASLHRKNPPA